MRIGILACGYNCADGLEDRLKPFMRDDFVISAVSAPFEGFPTTYRENEATVEVLTTLLKKDKIKWMYHSSSPQTELEARNNALIPLLSTEKLDYIFQLDLSDEYFKDKDIDNIIKFIEQNKDIAYFSINFKNYIFSRDAWIDGFCPARIHKVSFFNGQTLKISSFYEDNNIFYVNSEGYRILDKQLPHKEISKHLVFVRHDSWLNDDRSKKKVQYQLARGWIPSFKWDKENGLEYNPEYYRDKPYPELNRDE